MDAKNIVDGGLETVQLHFKVPTQGLAPGETMYTHLPAKQIQELAKLKSIDLINANKMTLDVHTSPLNQLGVSIAHGKDAEIALKTHNRAVVVDHDLGEAHGYHAVSTGARVAPVHTLHLMESEEQKLENRALVLKKMKPEWADMTPENVSAGAFETTIDEKPVILVSPQSSAGKASAVHRFLLHNETNAQLMGGRFQKSKRKETIAPNGLNAIIVPKSDFDEISDKLTGSLSTKSDFKHGITTTVTNISDEEITSKQPTFVNLTIHRTAIHPEEGLVSTKSVNPIGHADISKLTGATPATQKALPYKEAKEIGVADNLSGSD